MGESDDPDIAGHKRSWAKFPSFGRKARDQPASSQGPILPVSNPPTDDTTSEKTPHNAEPTLKRTTEGTHRNTPRAGSKNAADDTSPSSGSAPTESEHVQTGDSTIETKEKATKVARTKNAFKRGLDHAWEALTHSWVNVLLVCVPAGIAVKAAGLNPAVVFALNAVAIIPLAGLLTHATESVAARLGDTLGALLNVSFGNAVELIIFIIALVKNEIRIVQASLLGSILSNLLLILGMAFLFGGLRFQEQIYNSTITQMSACLLSLSVTSLLLPTAFHASFSDSADADDKTLKVSRGTSIILLIIYVLYLLFQLKSHAYMYESTPQHIIDEESHPGILAEMLDSSSSSSDSDTTSSSDTDTSGSHTTTKRIKRAFRNRRRRKSSVSSTTAPSVPSVVSSPSVERPGSFLEMPAVSQGTASRRTSALGAIVSGDEADTDGEREHRTEGEPRVRDFVETVRAEVAKEKERRKRRKQKKHRKHHRHHSKHDEHDDPKEGASKSHKHDEEPVSEKKPTGPRVDFDMDEQVHVIERKTDPAPRKGFGLGLPTRQSLRPSLPKMLSQNVFVQPPPRNAGSPSIGPQTVTRTGSGSSGLRRTNSLPDRLNRQESAAARQEALPPYPRAGQLSGRVRSFRSADANKDDDEDDEVKPPMSRTAAAVLLLVSTGLVAVCAEFLVDAIPGMIASTPVSQAFIGLIILPIVSNAAEHVTAVTVATKNKMDLAIGVAVGSSIQIALFVTPLVVILGWIIGRDMSLYFNLFETISLFVSVFVVNFLVLDGRSNYLEGSLLMAAYCIIAVAAYFYPNDAAQSSLGGGVS